MIKKSKTTNNIIDMSTCYGGTMSLNTDFKPFATEEEYINSLNCEQMMKEKELGLWEDPKEFDRIYKIVKQRDKDD